MTSISTVATCPTCGLVYVPIEQDDRASSPNFGHHREDFQWDAYGQASVFCDVCGMNYLLPQNQAQHCEFHAETLEAILPQRDKRFLTEPAMRGGLLPVTANSRQFLHDHVLRRAVAFRREFQYDFVQWPMGRETNPNTCGYLFVNTDQIAVGACKFEFDMWEGHSNSWSLEWVWIAPKYRRTAVLSQRWKTLHQIHGDFFNAPPLSPAFEAFLSKQGASRGDVK